MAKLTIKAIALCAFGFAFAGTASAAIKVSQDLQYASELFGTGSDTTVIEYGTDSDGRDNPLFVDLLVKAPQAAAGAVASSAIPTTDEAVLTVTVVGAEFAGTFGTNDLSVVQYNKTTTGAGTADEMVALTANTDRTTDASMGAGTNKEDGGARGDSSVEFNIALSAEIPTFDYTADGSGIPADSGTGNYTLRALRMEIPPLRNVNPKGVSVTIELEGTSSNSQWPEVRPMPGDGVASLIQESDDAVTMTITGGAGGINVDDRTKLDSRAQVAALGVLSLDVVEGIRQSNGDAFSVQDRRHSDGAGDVNVTITGDFREGDQVFWNWNGKDGLQEEEALDVGNGMAEGSFDLDALFIDANENQRMTPVAGALLYIPNGKDPMRNGQLAVAAMVDFDLGSMKDKGPGGATGELYYSMEGMRLNTVKAYALAPMSSGDETNVRLRCGQSFDCTVYMACDAADGTGFFGKMSDTIEPWSVATANSGMIADVIGADDSDFAGRMSCEVIGATQVQVLTRSDGVLVNNSFVGGN